MNTTQFIAPDIECDGCAAAIKKSLARVEGIGDVVVNVDAKTVTVTHTAPLDIVVNALDAAGFPVQTAPPQSA